MAKASKGDKIRINFTGRLEDGTIFDSTVEQDGCETDECGPDECGCEIGPMELVIGEGDFFPQVEKALLDLEVGSKINIVVKAEDAFGAYDEERVFVVEKEQFPEGLNPEPGQNLELIDEEDDATVVMVLDVDDVSVTLDANHPLAGEDLTFDVELLEIVAS
jgi:peptidylprolyl isomerase